MQIANPSDDLSVKEEIVSSAKIYFFALYGKKDFCGTLDKLRCHLFMRSKSDIRSLPATEDAFHLHLLRALHQIAVCKRAAEMTPVLPVATEFGRTVENGHLYATKMTKYHKPKIVTTYCKCKKGRCRSRCPCKLATVKCTVACMCCGDSDKCDQA